VAVASGWPKGTRRGRLRQLQNLVHARHHRHADAGDGGRARRGERTPEPHRLGLPDADVEPGDGPHLAAEPDFTDEDGLRVDLDAPLPAEHRRGDGEVDPRVLHGKAPDDVHVRVALGDRMAVERLDDADEQLDAARVDSPRPPARRGLVRADEERLHLDAERPAPLDDHGDGRTRPGGALREQELRRIVDLGKPVRAHLEQPDLVGRAEAVLHRPERP